MTMPSAEVRHNKLVSDFSPPRHEGTKNHAQELIVLGKERGSKLGAFEQTEEYACRSGWKRKMVAGGDL